MPAGSGLPAASSGGCRADKEVCPKRRAFCSGEGVFQAAEYGLCDREEDGEELVLATTRQGDKGKR
jgi:hypothetical protein